jgi:hypothetical protein
VIFEITVEMPCTCCGEFFYFETRQSTDAFLAKANGDLSGLGLDTVVCTDDFGQELTVRSIQEGTIQIEEVTGIREQMRRGYLKDLVDRRPEAV